MSTNAPSNQPQAPDNRPVLSEREKRVLDEWAPTISQPRRPSPLRNKNQTMTLRKNNRGQRQGISQNQGQGQSHRQDHHRHGTVNDNGATSASTNANINTHAPINAQHANTITNASAAPSKQPGQNTRKGKHGRYSRGAGRNRGSTVFDEWKAQAQRDDKNTVGIGGQMNGKGPADVATSTTSPPDAAPTAAAKAVMDEWGMKKDNSNNDDSAALQEGGKGKRKGKKGGRRKPSSGSVSEKDRQKGKEGTTASSRDLPATPADVPPVPPANPQDKGDKPHIGNGEKDVRSRQVPSENTPAVELRKPATDYKEKGVVSGSIEPHLENNEKDIRSQQESISTTESLEMVMDDKERDVVSAGSLDRSKESRPDDTASHTNDQYLACQPPIRDEEAAKQSQSDSDKGASACQQSSRPSTPRDVLKRALGRKAIDFVPAGLAIHSPNDRSSVPPAGHTAAQHEFQSGTKQLPTTAAAGAEEAKIEPEPEIGKKGTHARDEPSSLAAIRNAPNKAATKGNGRISTNTVHAGEEHSGVAATENGSNTTDKKDGVVSTNVSVVPSEPSLTPSQPSVTSGPSVGRPVLNDAKPQPRSVDPHSRQGSSMSIPTEDASNKAVDAKVAASISVNISASQPEGNSISEAAKGHGPPGRGRKDSHRRQSSASVALEIESKKAKDKRGATGRLDGQPAGIPDTPASQSEKDIDKTIAAAPKGPKNRRQPGNGRRVSNFAQPTPSKDGLKRVASKENVSTIAASSASDKTAAGQVEKKRPITHQAGAKSMRQSEIEQEYARPEPVPFKGSPKEVASNKGSKGNASSPTDRSNKSAVEPKCQPITHRGEVTPKAQSEIEKKYAQLPEPVSGKNASEITSSKESKADVFNGSASTPVDSSVKPTATADESTTHRDNAKTKEQSELENEYAAPAVSNPTADASACDVSKNILGSKESDTTISTSSSAGVCLPSSISTPDQLEYKQTAASNLSSQSVKDKEESHVRQEPSASALGDELKKAIDHEDVVLTSLSAKSGDPIPTSVPVEQPAQTPGRGEKNHQQQEEETEGRLSRQRSFDSISVKTAVSNQSCTTAPVDPLVSPGLGPVVPNAAQSEEQPTVAAKPEKPKDNLQKEKKVVHPRQGPEPKSTTQTPIKPTPAAGTENISTRTSVSDNKSHNRTGSTEKSHYQQDPRPQEGYTAPNGTFINKNQLSRLVDGVKTSHNTIYFSPSFIEDPWKGLRPAKLDKRWLSWL